MSLRDDRAGRLILSLRRQGVTDARVLKAMEVKGPAVAFTVRFGVTG